MTREDEDRLDRWEGSELGIHKKIRCRVDRIDGTSTFDADATPEPVLAWLFWAACRAGGWYFWKDKTHD